MENTTLDQVTEVSTTSEVVAKKSRKRPEVQQRYAQTLAACQQVLSDGTPRGVSALTRDLGTLGLLGTNVWSDVYHVLKTNECFVRSSVEGAKREKWSLVAETPSA